MDLEITASREINRGVELSVGDNQVELGTSSLIHDHLSWQGKRRVVHWGLHPLDKGKKLWFITADVMTSTGYVRIPLLFKEKFHM